MTRMGYSTTPENHLIVQMAYFPAWNSYFGTQKILLPARKTHSTDDAARATDDATRSTHNAALGSYRLSRR